MGTDKLTHLSPKRASSPALPIPSKFLPNPLLYLSQLFVTMKILIIEDERELAKDMVKYLGSEQYRCETAASYGEAIEKIAAYAYDCILLQIV